MWREASALIMRDRFAYMVEDIVEAQSASGRVEIRTGIGRRRRWTDKEKGGIVAEAVAPGAVVSEVARRHDLTPQHLFSWIKAAKAGRFALTAREDLDFVPVVVAEPEAAAKTPVGEPAAIEITIGGVIVRVLNGADARTVDAVLRAIKRVAL